MQPLRGTDDGVYRAGVDTQTTTDTTILVYACFQRLRSRDSRARIASKQLAKRLLRRAATRRTKVYGGAICDRACVGPATRVAALRALCLWQQRVDRIHHIVARVTKTAIGPEQQKRDGCQQSTEHNDECE